MLGERNIASFLIETQAEVSVSELVKSDRLSFETIHALLLGEFTDDVVCTYGNTILLAFPYTVWCSLNARQKELITSLSAESSASIKCTVVNDMPRPDKRKKKSKHVLMVTAKPEVSEEDDDTWTGFIPMERRI